MVNVVDLMKLQPQMRAPARALSDMDFDELFTKDKPVIFAFHAYPWLIHRLTYRRTNHDNIHVRGYKEEGTITTPFDMTVLNDLDRFHLVMDAIDRLPQTGRQGHLPEAAAQGQADRAQAVHRQERPGPAGDPELEVGQAQMSAQAFTETARVLVAGSRGLLAMDESNPTCNARFAALGIPQTEDARRAYRDWIVSTPGLSEYISGAILYDETIRQCTKAGAPFARAVADAGIIPGIKVDTGAKSMAGHPGEKITEGLDGLRDRLAEYAQMGARFAKWRAVITIGRRHSQPWLHRGQRAGSGSVRSAVPGGRARRRHRAGGAHGRCAHAEALPAR